MSKNFLKQQRERFKELINFNIANDIDYDKIVIAAIEIQIIDAKLKVHKEYESSPPGFNYSSDFDWD